MPARAAGTGAGAGSPSERATVSKRPPRVSVAACVMSPGAVLP